MRRIDIQINGKIIGSCSSFSKVNSPLLGHILEPWIDIDGFVPLKEPLNENQQIVLEWLKDELNDSYFKVAVSNLLFWARYDDVEGFPNERSHKMVQAFEELDDKDFAQVLVAFADWGMKEVSE